MPSFVTGLFNVPANFRTVVSGVGETSFDGPVSNLIRLPASTSAWRGSSSFLRFTRNTVAILETLRFYFLQRQTGDSGGSVFFETLGYCLPLTRYAPLYLKNGLPTLCRILQFHNLTNSAVSATLLNPSEEHRIERVKEECGHHAEVGHVLCQSLRCARDFEKHKNIPGSSTIQKQIPITYLLDSG